MNIKHLKTLVLAMLVAPFLFAGEGMWLPMFIKKMNYADMQAKGLKLTAEDIYDINNSSLKDAVVGLGRPNWDAQFNFCSGEIISSKGLFLTNHHCGFDAIQSLSSTEHNYLEEGYWAMEPKQEMPAGFCVHILQRMDDVTAAVLEGIDFKTDEKERQKMITSRIDSLKKEAEKDTLITAVIKPFFKGNEYYMFLYKVYEDVRFVGAPPSAVGKFGGDTDNWMWPRHTGDFSIFRIYADENNNPAPYSEKNVPYQPKHFLPISLKGVEKDDYAMIFGFPGSTDRFLTSYGVSMETEMDQPARVKIRRKKLDIYEEGMEKSKKTRLQYASKHSSVSNYWKYFLGQTQGLKRLHVYEKKKKQEEAFANWISGDAKRQEIYGSVLSDFAKGYEELSKYQLSSTYLSEAIYGVEILRFSRSFSGLEKLLKDGEKGEKLQKAIAALRPQIDDHFKDYDRDIDQKVLAAMLKYYYDDIPRDQQAAMLMQLVEKYKHDFDALAAAIFAKSVFVSREGAVAFLDKPSLKKLEKDPAYSLISAIRTKYNTDIAPKYQQVNESLEITDRLFVKGLREMNPDKTYYPDANSTMRITYGQVLDYYPRDAVYYNYYTTLEGVMEKEDTSNLEFIVPAKLKELYRKKDYGRYGKNGKLVVNFISNNDITGGNSGSPVINGNGELIGTAFDGNWEAMSGDIAFEPELQRTISTDIRYTLFIIDKLGGAGYLIDEMKLVE